MPEKIFTIGHSNLTFMRFMALIQAHNINHVIDIRSIPYSRYAPWSSKSRLPALLKPFKIKYTYYGHQLGGKKQTVDQITKQQSVTSQPVYDNAINNLLRLSKSDIITVFCAEGDPANCHRQHIIAQSLLNSGVEVAHILKDGTLKKAWREDVAADQPELF